MLGYGWYFVESYWGDRRIKYRWSQREAVVYLWNHFGRGTLEMEVLGSATAAGRPRVFYVSVNDRPAARFELRTDDWETIHLDLAEPAGPLEITIRTDETWSPDAVAHNGDDRELGIGVKQIQFRPLAETAKTWDGISVIIPTYNRCQKLAKVLRRSNHRPWTNGVSRSSSSTTARPMPRSHGWPSSANRRRCGSATCPPAE